MTALSAPAYYDWYPSRWCSDWYVWFCELGYPMLDLRRWLDGEWAIMQYHSKPYMPSLTKWHWVLSDLRHVDITEGFISKWCQALDLTRREIWDREDAKTKEIEREQLALQKHNAEMVDKAHESIVRNPELMERIAKYGFEEMDLRKIARNIPGYRW